MKRGICLLLAAVLLGGLLFGCSDTKSIAAPGEKRDPTYTLSGDIIRMDCGSFTLEYPSTLSENVKEGTIVSDQVFLDIAVPVNDSLVSSSLSVLRSDEMKGSRVSDITEEQAQAYAQAAAESFGQQEAKNVALERQNIGSREMAVVTYQVDFTNDAQEIYAIYCRQFILPMDDCGYVFLLAYIDETENEILDGVMDSLTLSK